MDNDECQWQTLYDNLKDRGAHLLDSDIWTDCVFLVGCDEPVMINGHKLILSMASPIFADMFFKKHARDDPISVSDIEPDVFKIMLKYIYSEKLIITNFYEAKNVYYAASKYVLPHLQKKCHEYIASSIDCLNACAIYELAVSVEDFELMNITMQYIRDNTQAVLEKSILRAQISTIVDIFEQNKLNIDSELDLYHTAVLYAELNTEHNPESTLTIYDAMRKIRYLTMSYQQFAEGPGQSKLLNDEEKRAILIRLATMDAACDMPEGFSTSTTNRCRSDPTCCIRDLTDEIDRVCNTETWYSISVKVDAHIALVEIKIPTQTGPVGETYNEKLLAYIYCHDDQKRVAERSFEHRVPYNNAQSLLFSKPCFINKHKVYNISLQFYVEGNYPHGKAATMVEVDDVTFDFRFPTPGSGPQMNDFIQSILFKKLDQ